MKIKGYTIRDFKAEYSSDSVCLDRLFKLRFGELKICPKCNSTNGYKRVKDRTCYYCPKCYNQIHPMVGTIFYRSSTPLSYWFYAMFLFTSSKNGLSACELQRQIGCTYKTCWRMLMQIRRLLVEDKTLFTGIVECDETFVGGKNINRHRDKKVENSQGRSFKDKTPVFGVFSRSTGKVYTKVMSDTKASSIMPIILSKVAKNSHVMSDEWGAYSSTSKNYKHDIVYHCRGEYSNGNVTTNHVENFWSVFKRTIKGSYIHVSPKYLQLYADEVTFRFNNRSNKQIFNTLVTLIA